MNEKDKELLLKDLCARLPYGIKVEYKNEKFGIEYVSPMYEEVKLDIRETWTVDVSDIKPYLFPLSSMTEEQKRELRQMDAFINSFGNICFAMYDEYCHDIIPTYEDAIRITNWCNKNHFDYRGLIPKGIANDATGLNIY